MYLLSDRRITLAVFLTSCIALFAYSSNLLAAGLADAAKPSPPNLPRVDRRNVPEEGKLFLVPPMVDRPLTADEGERLIVRAFALRGVVDRPQYGLMIRDVEAILESQRLEKQKLKGDVVEGFTPGALVESAKILRELVDRREKGLATPEDMEQVQQLIQKLKDVEYNQGLTIGELQEIVDHVTRYYRRKGFILAQAYIPAQTITNGVVIVQVLEGTLNDVVVEGNTRYSDETLKAPFEDLVGLPVVKQPLESALLELTDFPGLSAFGVFRPGKDIGSAQLVIKVQKEQIADASFSMDNYGSEYTGRYRGIINYSLYNMLASQDRLYGNLYKTFDPSNGAYGSISYEAAVPNNRNIVGINASRNEFTLEEKQGSVPGSGDTSQGGLYYRHTLKRSRATNQYLKLAFFRKRANVKLFEEPHQQPFRDDLAVATAEFRFDSLAPKSAGINMGYLRYSHGFEGILGVPKAGEETMGKLNPNAKTDFNKVEMGYTRYQSLDTSNSLLFSLRGQYSNDSLASLEQVSIGGPDSVRAYPVARYLRDRAYLTTIEWISKAPGAGDVPVFGNKTWSDIMKMSVFFDAARGSNVQVPIGDHKSDRNGVTAMGVGVAFNLKLDKFNARLDVGWPLGAKEADKDKGAQTYFSASYNF